MGVIYKLRTQAVTEICAWCSYMISVLLRTVGPSLLTVGHTLRTVDPSLRNVGPTLRTVGPSLRTVGHTLRTVDPSLRTVGPTLCTVGPMLGRHVGRKWHCRNRNSKNNRSKKYG